MNNLFPKRFGFFAKSIIRYIHRSAIIKEAHYEDGGRTILNVLNKKSADGLLIDSCNRMGFTLNSGAFIIGPIVIFPKAILSWDIESSKHMNRDSLCLFSLLEPKLDIVVIGLDNDKYIPNAPFITEAREYLNELQIAVEILPVKKACTVYNFLYTDNVNAAAALIPPVNMETVMQDPKLQPFTPPALLNREK
ncbi:NADH dehydrogenase [ubiquinone] 1 alpha subcomplex assembly factor 3 [Cephus cinctus]|uniref:NADH dehydrogenase [ubiquinone] 1 alpha subcomplex assembly factor 3 n=1 Tax=Cephus cinctus TaxID=211228 RepID=A0AAJ7BLC7_CEPCN|nr:NADH dehydrogenase [ubiquinone] 1 alpha subcomplex assembly factor 3 [Cephus cinctus]